MSARVIASLGMVALLTACTSVNTSADQRTPVPAADAGTPGSAASELEGLWHTGSVTPDDAMAALQTGGLQAYAQGFFDFWKIGNENVFALRISGGKWTCYRSKDGGHLETEDDGRYSISGNTVTVQHSDEGADTFQWSVSGDTLTVTYLSDTIGPPDLPRGEEIYQRVLYMSSPWTRGLP